MTPTDSHIAEAIRQDANQGFRLLLTKYQQAVYWHIRRLLVSHDDTLDATQETFIRVYRNLDTYSGKGSFAGWIYRIATNEALRVLSHRQNKEISLDSEESGTTLEAYADEYVDYSNAEAVLLQKAILTLPPKQQVAFNLRHFNEMSYEDMAQAMDCSASAAKANYHLAKTKITVYLNRGYF